IFILIIMKIKGKTAVITGFLAVILFMAGSGAVQAATINITQFLGGSKGDVFRLQGALKANKVFTTNNMRVDGDLYREEKGGGAPVRINDKLFVTGNIKMKDGKKVDGVDVSAIPDTYLPLSGGTMTGGLNMGGKSIANAGTVTGSFIGNVSGNAGTVTNGVYTTGSYTNPAWINSLSAAKLTSGTMPGSLTVATDLTVAGDLDAAGSVNLGTAGGTADVVARGDLNVAENFDVDGTSNFDGDVTIDSDHLYASDSSFNIETTTPGADIGIHTTSSTSDSGDINFNWNQLYLDLARFNVGIGNDDPDSGYLLDVKYGAASTDEVKMKIESNSTSTLVMKAGDNVDNTIDFQRDSGSVGKLFLDDSNRFRLLRGSTGITINGNNVGINTPNPQSALHVENGQYAQFSNNGTVDPPSGDCDSDDELGRLYIRTDTQEFWICGGATNGWDYITLTD
ncbi:hypothetical protein KJ839_03640, partial [Patescibacteria group bacterium]|nr:hypothetical protein [Patescibacteria group bacterium]